MNHNCQDQYQVMQADIKYMMMLMVKPKKITSVNEYVDFIGALNNLQAYADSKGYPKAQSIAIIQSLLESLDSGKLVYHFCDERECKMN